MIELIMSEVCARCNDMYILKRGFTRCHVIMENMCRNAGHWHVMFGVVQIMDHGAAVTWEDIAGLEFAKKTIKEIVVWPMLRP